MNICIMGPPGSGKSTQGKILAKSLGLPHVSTGDIFRKLEKENTPFARRIRKVFLAGGLISDGDVVRVVGERMARKDVLSGFVLDGYPRTLGQARKSLVKFDIVFFLKVSRKESLRRLLSRGRTDDLKNIVSERLLEYEKSTAPILDFYRRKGILLPINGERPVEEIAREIKKNIL